jgi:hypothetical protein
MDPWAVGVALSILGMGGTVLSLWFISLLVDLLKRLFPYNPEAE